MEKTFGMTIVEAAFVGTKTVAFSSTATGEIVSQVYGVQVMPGDVSEMAKVIRFLCNKSARLRLTNTEIEAIKAKFGSKTMANNYTALYETVLKR